MGMTKRAAKKDKLAAMVAAGILPSDAALVLEEAEAAGQALPLPEEVNSHAPVTDADIVRNQVWWMNFAMKSKKRRRYARLPFAN